MNWKSYCLGMATVYLFVAVKGDDFRLRIAEAHTAAKLAVILIELVKEMYPPQSAYRYPM